ncbi:MAG TPA: DHA2 family efflux MFS transporter permease subunit [Acidothermaceae bacterium]|nr:DHA2 family efflux MFS transporter permease subunit [Acidothermaceae bacterium]
MTGRGRPLATFVVTSVALFMGALDNLVVTMALPAIKAHLHASLASLEWTVNAYTLTFAVLLLPGATLGDRFGRKKMFLIGLGIFTGASALAALSSSADQLIAARALQGVGGAIITPLTLTLLSVAVPPAKRGLALGAWGAIAGLAIAVGPVVGGAIVDGASWSWIFWLNVPIGVALLPLAGRLLAESHGTSSKLDGVGTVLATAGLFSVVLGLVRANDWGWGSGRIIGLFVASAVFLAAFVRWEAHASEPVLPLRLFQHRGFTMSNVASLFMFFGMFGSIFLLAQYLQVGRGYSPLSAGVRTLPWTAMPIFVAPIAGMLSDRIGGRRIVAVGLFLQAIGLGWLATVASPTVSYLTMVPGLAISGFGMALFFAPVANLVLSSVRHEEQGIASGAHNAIRELGGVFGVAVLASVFAHSGGYSSPQAFTDGVVPAVWVGAAIVALGGVAALLIPRRAVSDVAVGGEAAALTADTRLQPTTA